MFSVIADSGLENVRGLVVLSAGLGRARDARGIVGRDVRKAGSGEQEHRRDQP